MTDEFQFNENYSTLKEYCAILCKELSTMKEKNYYLNQKVNELELTISSLGQYSVTKAEMKEIIKEGIAPIINILIGKDKEMVDAETQIDNVIIPEKKEDIIVNDNIQNIKRIEVIM